MKTPVPVLIVARPGRLRDAWRALLMATPDIEMVHQADDASAALRLVEAHEPGLILLDSDLGKNGPWGLLQQIKAGHPHCSAVVLVCNNQERARAQAAGADVVLLRGFPAERLFQAIEHLIHQAE